MTLDHFFSLLLLLFFHAAANLTKWADDLSKKSANLTETTETLKTKTTNVTGRVESLAQTTANLTQRTDHLSNQSAFSAATAVMQEKNLTTLVSDKFLIGLASRTSQLDQES